MLGIWRSWMASVKENSLFKSLSKIIKSEQGEVGDTRATELGPLLPRGARWLSSCLQAWWQVLSRLLGCLASVVLTLTWLKKSCACPLSPGLGGKLWKTSDEREFPACKPHWTQPVSPVWLLIVSTVLFQTNRSLQEGIIYSQSLFFLNTFNMSSDNTSMLFNCR